MSVVMAQAKIEAERVTDVQAATKKMFAAIDAAHPEGIRYASVLLPDGETFVALLQVDDGARSMPPSCQNGDPAGWHRTVARFTPVSIAGQLAGGSGRAQFTPTSGLESSYP